MSSPSTADCVESTRTTTTPSPNHTTPQKFIVCPAPNCKQTYTRIDKVRKHVRTMHDDLSAETVYNALYNTTGEGVKMECPVETCEMHFVMRNMRTHLGIVHKEWLGENGRYESKKFKDMETFKAWKNEYEMQHGISHNDTMKPTFTSHVFVCNRHQTTDPKPASTGRSTAKKRTHVKPPCKTQKCPGRIYVKVAKDGSVFVEVYNIHTHPVGTGNMMHLPLSQEMKTHITSELLAGVSEVKIYKDMLGDFMENVSCVLVMF